MAIPPKRAAKGKVGWAGFVLLGVVWLGLAGLAQANELIRPHTTLEEAPSWYEGNDFDLIDDSLWRVLAEGQDSSMASSRSFSPAVFEFPQQEFSFTLVEYSSPIRVVENEMLFRFEAPGVGRALVSCEFIF
ncbi:MAG: hypothetical protein CL917_12450 [Deltaproteobacteria bacterium]|nr:hypothetical protein [Deltaproteobacteria bacterium]